MKELITYPLNDVDYSAEDAGLFHCTRTSGVWHKDSFPITVSSADNTVTIGKGLAWFSNDEFWGKVAAQKTVVELDLEYSDPAYDRIDIIALQFDANKNATNLIVKKGEAKTNPTIPAISRTEALYELYLYAITRPAASVTIAYSNVRDLRLDDEYCGLMADSVTSLDFPIVPVEKGGTGVSSLDEIKSMLELTELSRRDLATVPLGGTGKNSHVLNSVLIGNGVDVINNVQSGNGAFYSTSKDGRPLFGTLPIEQGGTGGRSAEEGLCNLMSAARAVGITGNTIDANKTIHIPGIDAVIVGLRVRVNFAMEKAVWYTIANVPLNIVPSVSKALNATYMVEGEQQFSAYINTKGEIRVKPSNSTGEKPDFKLYVSGVYIL